jgi:hypothetical protein
MIEETYAKRAELKAAGDGGEVVLKLALNSGYGITAQTAGAYREVNEQGETTGYHTPSSSNITLAAWDTAYVRARIYRALCSPGTVATATDAIYSTVPLVLDGDIHTGGEGTGVPELGSWEAKEHTVPVLLVAPGLAVTQADMLKKRGIGGYVDVPALIDAWERGSRVADGSARDRDNGNYVFPIAQQRYKDLRASLHYDKQTDTWTRDADWGEFHTVVREMNLTPSILASKRDTSLDYLMHPPHAFTTYPPYHGGTQSVGYRRPFDVDMSERIDTIISQNETEREGRMYAL